MIPKILKSNSLAYIEFEYNGFVYRISVVKHNGTKIIFRLKVLFEENEYDILNHKWHLKQKFAEMHKFTNSISKQYDTDSIISILNHGVDICLGCIEISKSCNPTLYSIINVFIARCVDMIKNQ